MSLSQLNLLFGFCLLFGIIFAAIAYQWQKGYFLLGSAIVTFFMLGGYVARCGGTVLPGDATCFFLWVVCLLVLYSAPVFIFPARLADSIPSWVTLLFVGGLGAVYIYTVSYCTYHIENGLIPFSFMCVYGGVYGAVLTGVLNPLKQRDFALAGLGLLNIFFLTWSIICQFEREYLTLFLALEGCAFLFLAKFKQVSWLHGVSIALVGIALAKLFLADIWMLEILARIVVLIGVAVVLITGAFLYQNIKPKKEDESVENQ